MWLHYVRGYKLSAGYVIITALNVIYYKVCVWYINRRIEKTGDL